MKTVLFVYDTPIKHTHGGVQKVSLVLANEFEKHNLRCMFLSVSTIDGYAIQDGDNCQFFLPEKKTLSEANFTYLKDLIDGNEIATVINQSALGGGLSLLMETIKKIKNDIRILSVIHNSVLANAQNISFRYGISNNLLKSILDSTLIRRVTLQLYLRRYRSKYIRLVDVSDKVIVLSDSYVHELTSFIGDSSKVIAIPNPISLAHSYKWSRKSKTVLFVGRIDNSQKRLDVLLRIWKGVESKNKEWHLKILGDGLDKENMIRLASQLKLENVSFLGLIPPHAEYSNAKILCLTSAFEGFPMVIPECQSYGVVPVCFDSFSAVHDLITHYQNGLIINAFDTDAFVESLLSLMINQELLEDLASNAMNDVNKYKLKNIVALWLVVV